ILPGGEQREIGWFANDLRPEITQHHPHHFPLGPLDGLGPGDDLRFTFTPSPAAAAHSAGIEEIAGEPFEVELVYPEPPRIINGHLRPAAQPHRPPCRHPCPPPCRSSTPPAPPRRPRPRRWPQGRCATPTAAPSAICD